MGVFVHQLFRNKGIYSRGGAVLLTAAFKEITTGIQPAISRLRSDKLLREGEAEEERYSWRLKDV